MQERGIRREDQTLLTMGLRTYNKIQKVSGVFVLLTLSFFIALPAFSIEEVDKANVARIDYDSILKTAIEHSYDVKTSRVNIEISKQRLSGAKREYIPNLSIGVNSEYNKGLDNNSQGIRTINGAIINGVTRFQDSVSVNLQHSVVDWGIKRKQVNIAHSDILQKETLLVQTFRDLKLEILGLYSQILATHLELENLRAEQGTQKEILSMQGRLYKAGFCTKIELKQTEADLNTIQIRIENTNIILAELLAELSFYTNTNYRTSDSVGVFSKDALLSLNSLNEIDYTKSPEYISYQREIDKKRSELAILKKQRLPQIFAYSGYSIYGTDNDSFSASLSDMRQSNISVGLSTSLGLTEQLKQTPKIKETQLQIQSLEIEQMARTSGFFKEVNKTRQLIEIYKIEKKKNDELKMVLDEKLKMFERLDKNRLINKTDYLVQLIQNNRQNTEFKIIEQKAIAQNIKLKYLLEDLGDVITDGAVGINNI